MIARKALALGTVLVAMSAGAARAEEIIANDLLLATLWTQRSVEFKGNALTVYALGKIRLDQALTDKAWTAAPVEQKGDYQNLPPAVVLDLDETVLDNSAYQVWNIKAGQSFSLKTWNEFCAAQVLPPSWLTAITPKSPTAKPSVVVGKATPKRVFVLAGFCDAERERVGQRHDRRERDRIEKENREDQRGMTWQKQEQACEPGECGARG